MPRAVEAFGIVALTIAGTVAPAAVPPPPPADLAPPAVAATALALPDAAALSVMGVSINGLAADATATVAVRDGATYVAATDYARWRLRPPPTTETFDGEAFVALDRVPGLRHRIDAGQQILILDVAPELFETTRIDAAPTFLAPSPAAPSAFLNYDLSFERGDGSDLTGAYLSMGASNDHGLIASTVALGATTGDRHATRLETYVIRDDPGGLTRLQIGDGLTRGASFAPQLRFGGIRYGTNFGLQPGLVAFPTPLFDGRASLPSSVELYLNGVLRYQSQVAAGPFALDRLPIVSGAGQVTLQVRDVLGVERRVVTDYYVSTQLLRPGLTDFSIEAGAERQRFGSASFDYGRGFVAGTWRRGLTPHLTIETRGEAAGDLAMAGGGLAATIGTLGEMSAAAAISEGPDGAGWLYRITAGRYGTRWSVGITWQDSSRDFAELGLAGRSDRPRRLLQANAGVTLGARDGNFATSYALLERADGTRSTVLSATYSRRLARIVYMNAFAIHSRASGDGNGATLLGVGLSMPLGQRTTAYAQIDSGTRRVELQRSLPSDRGWGYRLVASQGEFDQQQADLSYRSPAIDLVGQVTRLKGQAGARLLANGGLVLAGGTLTATRRLDDGFAVVEVPGAAGVRVFQDNREVGRTNRRGIAIVPQLRPFEANRISVAPDDLHLDTVIASDTLVVVPRYLGGVRARFAVGGGHAGSVLLAGPDGKPIEPGTVVRRAGGTIDMFVGLDGEVFLDNLAADMVLVVQRADGPCHVVVPPVPAGQILPRVGPVACRPSGPK